MLMTHAVSNAWRAISGLARRRRVATSIGLVAAGLTVGISVQAYTAGSASAVTWKPLSAQANRAIIVAYLEASSTIPSATGAPVTPFTMPISRARSLISVAPRETSWPSNISSIDYIGSYRQAASQFVDGSKVPDNRAVIVLRMTGRFSVLISAPKGALPYATGTVLTAVLDANTGEVLDFGLANSAKSLPSPEVLFIR
jgi:hypothetical protein